MSELTLDDAIKHCLEVVRKNEQAKKSGDLWIDTEYEDCCADHRQLAEWLTELKEAKRLLKAAVEDMTKEADCGICLHDNDGECPIEVTACKFKWRYADEALTLIGEDGEQNG